MGTLKIGDVVRLSCGGPDMMVLDTDAVYETQGQGKGSPGILCVWFDKNDCSFSQVFPEKGLRIKQRDLCLFP